MKRRFLGAVSAAVIGFASLSVQAVGVSGQGTWETTLQGRDLDGNLATFEAYYDTDLDVTWMANLNYVAVPMSWAAATAWAANLNPFGSGITGWRLPTVTDVGNNGPSGSIYQGIDWGYNLNTANGEMAHMFYATLGNFAAFDTSGTSLGCGGSPPLYCLANSGPFSIPLAYSYWSDTSVAISSSIRRLTT